MLSPRVYLFSKMAVKLRSLLNCVPCVLKTCSRANVSCVLTWSLATCRACLRTHVPTYLACLRAIQPTCSACLCAHALTYLACLHAIVPTCPACLCVHLPTYLARLRAHVPMCLACLRAHVRLCLVCLCAHVPKCLFCFRANVLWIPTWSCKTFGKMCNVYWYQSYTQTCPFFIFTGFNTTSLKLLIKTIWIRNCKSVKGD